MKDCLKSETILSDVSAMLEIVESWTEIKTIKKEIDNIGKNKKKLAFRIMLKQVLRKIKRVKSKIEVWPLRKLLNKLVNVNKRCRLLRTLAKDMKATKVLPLSKYHQEKHGNI